MFFVTDGGQIWFTRRAVNGSWSPALRLQNPALPGAAGDLAVSHLGTAEMQILATAAFGGGLWHSLWDNEGKATQFGDVETQAGQRPPFLGVDAAHGSLQSIGGGLTRWQLHVVGCDVNGDLWHTLRYGNGAWMPFGNIEQQASDIGSARSVACAYYDGPLSDQLHVVAVTNDYRLKHTTLRVSTNDSWSPFIDVEMVAGETGSFLQASCACIGPDLHLCAITGDGNVKHAVRTPAGAWTPLGDVETQAGDVGQIEYVGCEAGAQKTLQVVVLTSAQRVLHTQRNQDSSWTPFRDVEGQCGSIGSSSARPRRVAL
ncbi:hypothetical protein [Streptomyces sp. NPDC000878]